jgi:hypothetical protein
VEAHKGEIKVENKNPGVIFTITIQTEIPDMAQFRDNNE